MAKIDGIFSKLAKELEIDQMELKSENNKELALIEKESTASLEKTIYDVYTKQSFSYIDDIVDDEETRDFLKKNTLKILVQDNTNKLILGKILQDVFYRIGNSKNGEYGKWLNKTGIPERTALRYRNRYNFFKKLESFNARKQILNMSHEMIEQIIKNDETEVRVIHLLEMGADIGRIKSLLSEIEENEVIEMTNTKNTNKTELNIDILVDDVKTKWNHIPESKKEKVEELFKKIKKLLDE
jgi:hypothetical protein